MRILFDQGVPAPLRAFLEGEIHTCFERGWSHLSNGELIEKADAEFDVFVTTDKNLRYQQNLEKRTVAILVLPTTRWPNLKPVGPEIALAVGGLSKGAYIEWNPSQGTI
jgi:hypothetical protein